MQSVIGIRLASWWTGWEGPNRNDRGRTAGYLVPYSQYYYLGLTAATLPIACATSKPISYLHFR